MSPSSDLLYDDPKTPVTKLPELGTVDPLKRVRLAVLTATPSLPPDLRGT